MLFSVTARQILRKPVGPIDEKDFKHVEDAFFPGVLDLIILLVKVAFFFFLTWVYKLIPTRLRA